MGLQLVRDGFMLTDLLSLKAIRRLEKLWRLPDRVDVDINSPVEYGVYELGYKFEKKGLRGNHVEIDLITDFFILPKSSYETVERLFKDIGKSTIYQNSYAHEFLDGRQIKPTLEEISDLTSDGLFGGYMCEYQDNSNAHQRDVYKTYYNLQCALIFLQNRKHQWSERPELSDMAEIMDKHELPRYFQRLCGKEEKSLESLSLKYGSRLSFLLLSEGFKILYHDGSEDHNLRRVSKLFKKAKSINPQIGLEIS